MATGEQQEGNRSLNGTRVLLIEDEYFIADEVRRILADAGAEVATVATVAKANAALDAATFDCVMLDLNLSGESAIPVGDRLAEEGRTFAIATGYGSPAIPDRLKHVPRLEKPFDPIVVLRLVEQLVRASAE